MPAGGDTIEHYHRTSEEIYLFTRGSGRMRLGDDQFQVRSGDCVVIAPGVRHKLWADDELQLWCCCAPAYSHEDTVLLEQR